ncbi:hypothetical protein HGA91_05895 [candidate division WWE3 bacterium]|nr:hypothetical protein [candidate division WWE3 bacterium]
MQCLVDDSQVLVQLWKDDLSNILSWTIVNTPTETAQCRHSQFNVYL